MCTLIAIRGRSPLYPLVVAANRDELYARPTAPPQLIHAHPRAVAGVDLEKGGTWMGANDRGLFAALTNQRTHVLRPSLRSTSRGQIVRAALACPDVDALQDLLEDLDPARFEGFNLMYGDGRSLWVAYARPDRPVVERVELGDGVWVLPNDVLGSPEFPKTLRAAELVTPSVESSSWEALRDGLIAALGDHETPERVPDPPPGSAFDAALLRELQALCVHTPGYGTSSATLLALEPGRVARYLFADGPPCRSPFEDLTPLLRG